MKKALRNENSIESKELNYHLGEEQCNYFNPTGGAVSTIFYLPLFSR